jgi:hypothetical protein
LASSALRFTLKGCGVLLLVLALSGTAFGKKDDDDGNKGEKGPGSVPELNAGSIASGAALLSGGLLLLTSRRRREQVGS